MFSHLAKHPKILVTGPYRSGCRIAAKIIAADTGYACVYEDDLLTQDRRTLRGLYTDDEPIVVQAPSLVYLADTSPWLLVFMVRDIDSITRSCKRVDAGIGSAQHQYEHWQNFQRPMRDLLELPYLELEYMSLDKHAFWVPPEHRRYFRRDQTRRDRVLMPDTWAADALRKLRNGDAVKSYPIPQENTC